MKVLIVEDSFRYARSTRTYIGTTGLCSGLSDQGEEGVEKAIAEKPNLILLDMMMPIMDGREVARRLRANAETKEIPILAITALFRSQDLDDCLLAGCNGYIVKPFSVLDLQAKIRELLAGTGSEA
jgi:DNA-binding response OmpR family regulator